MDALLARALQLAGALGVSEARCHAVATSLAKELGGAEVDDTRLANALLDAQPPPSGTAEVVDLTHDGEEAPPPRARAAPGDAGGAKRKRPLEAGAVAAAPPAAAAPSAPPAAASAAAAMGGNSLMAQLAAERLARRGAPAPAAPSVPPLPELKLLTYNVWFEPVAMEARMRGIGAVVAAEAPHVLCLQEVTSDNERLLRAQPFWRDYDVSPAPPVPYYTLLLIRKPLRYADSPLDRALLPCSQQGRDLIGGILEAGAGSGVRFFVATSHLESYTGPTMTNGAARVAQLREAIRGMDSMRTRNYLYAGDFNWDDGGEGRIEASMSPGWADVWSLLRPGEAGYTYDAAENAMLGSWKQGLRKRLDRIVFKSVDYEAASVRLVGTAPLPGQFYDKQYRNGGSRRLPVLPSDHFGLLCTLRPRPPAGRAAN